MFSFLIYSSWSMSTSAFYYLWFQWIVPYVPIHGLRTNHIHIPIPILCKKFFKTNANLNSFFQKNWFSNAKSRTVTKFEQKVLPKIPQQLFVRSAQSAKIFGIFKKKLLLGVHSPCTYSTICLIGWACCTYL